MHGTKIYVYIYCNERKCGEVEDLYPADLLIEEDVWISARACRAVFGDWVFEIDYLM